MADVAATIGVSAAALIGNPADLGRWFELARALTQTTERERAIVAHRSLGQASNKLGAVALAIACVKALRDLGAVQAASSLLDDVAKTHCHGSPHIDKTLAAKPAVPPPPATKRAEEFPRELPAALKLADQAIELASRAATQRAPAKLPPTPLVATLGPGDLRELVDVVKITEHASGDVVIAIGDRADSLYWVARGAVQVTRDDHVLGEVRSNAFFGEIALVGGTKRTAKVVCIEPTWLVEIPARSVEQAALKAPRLATVLARYARSRLLANVMRTSELFSRLSDAERQLILSRFSTQMFDAGERLLKTGELNEHLYVIVSGACSVRDGSDIVARLSVGDATGEMSLLSRRPVTFDVVAIDRTVTLTLSRDDFNDIALAHPELLAEVYKLLVAREQVNRDTLIHDASDLIL